MSATPPPPPPPPSPPPSDGFSGGFAADVDDAAAPVAGAALGPDGHTIPPAWKRIVARLVDWVVVYLVIGTVLGFIILGDDLTADPTTDDVEAGASVLVVALMLAVSFVWEAVATRVTGGTPTKRLFKMRVVQAETVADVEWRHAIVRWAAFAALGFVPFVGVLAQLVIVIVSLVFLFTKPLRRAVWDLAAKTIVVDG